MTTQPTWMHRKAGVPNFTERTVENRDDDQVLHLPRRFRRGYVYRCATCDAECNGAAQFCPAHLRITLRP